jgi:molybdopterin biosynthesis enzyme
MLPGHIGSCIGGFYLFLAPLISVYCGRDADAAVPQIPAVLGEEVEAGPQFRFLLVNLRRVEGKLVAMPTQGGSSALTTIVKSNGYTIIPPHIKKAKGDEVTAYLFGKLEIAKSDCGLFVLRGVQQTYLVPISQSMQKG